MSDDIAVIGSPEKIAELLRLLAPQADPPTQPRCGRPIADHGGPCPIPVDRPGVACPQHRRSTS